MRTKIKWLMMECNETESGLSFSKHHSYSPNTSWTRTSKRFKWDVQFQNLWQLCSEIDNQYKILTQPNDNSKCDSSQPPITYTYINAVETPKRTVTSSHCCQLLLKQLNLPEYWALCELCWLLVSSLWKRQKRCNKQTMGFKSANILRVLMDA